MLAALQCRPLLLSRCVRQARLSRGDKRAQPRRQLAGSAGWGRCCAAQVLQQCRARPLRRAGGRRCEDDLTYALGEVVKANNRLRRQEENGAPQHIIREFAALLQHHITTMFDNTKPGLPVAQQRSGRPLKSISQRLKVWRGARGSLFVSCSWPQAERCSCAHIAYHSYRQDYQ